MKKQKQCGMLIKQIHDGLEKNANNALRDDNITMTQIGTLIELSNAPQHELTLKELEKRLHVAQPTAAGIVSRLEEKGLVEGFAGREDKRIKIVHITESGLNSRKKADNKMQQAEKQLLAGFSEEEKENFNNYLERVLNNIK
jgi:Transcriptional regulators